MPVVCPADGHDLQKTHTMYQVCNSETYEILNAFWTFRQAQRFARYYLHRQHLYQKVLAAAAILSKYQAVLYTADNCKDALVWDNCYIPQLEGSYWFDESPEVVRGCFTDEDIDSDLPLELRHTIFANRERKKQCDFAVFTGQNGDCWCIDRITDIWPVDDKTFVFESDDGHMYAAHGLEDDEAQIVINKYFSKPI